MFLIFASSFAPLSSHWEVWTACFRLCRLISGRFLRPFSLMAAVCQHHRQATRSGTVINLHQFLSDKTIFCTCLIISCYLATTESLSPHPKTRQVGDQLKDTELVPQTTPNFTEHFGSFEHFVLLRFYQLTHQSTENQSVVVIFFSICWNVLTK